MKATENTTFTFYKDNRNDGQYSLTVEEIKEKYLAWLKTKERSWVEYYGHRTVWAFISDKDGLSSVVGDPAYYADLEDMLMETRHSLYG